METSNPRLTPWAVVVVAQSCLTFYDPMDCSMPGFPVLHHLPELAQTHVHWVSGAIQPSCSMSSPSLTFNLSQHQGLFQWVGSSHQMAKVLKLQLQHQSFSWINIQGWFPLGLTGWISHLSKEWTLHVRWPKYWSFSFSISPSMDFQGWFPLDWLVWSPCCSRDSQESSPTP